MVDITSGRKRVAAAALAPRRPVTLITISGDAVAPPHSSPSLYYTITTASKQELYTSPSPSSSAFSLFIGSGDAIAQFHPLSLSDAAQISIVCGSPVRLSMSLSLPPELLCADGNSNPMLIKRLSLSLHRPSPLHFDFLFPFGLCSDSPLVRGKEN